MRTSLPASSTLRAFLSAGSVLLCCARQGENLTAPMEHVVEVQVDAGAPPSLFLGTGEALFEAWEGRPRLGLSAGAQGGYHVWVSFVVSGLSPYGPNDNLLGVELSTQRQGVSGSRLFFQADLATRLYEPDSDSTLPSGPGVRTFAGYPAQIAAAPCANGQQIKLKLTVTGADGLSAETEGIAILEVRPEIVELGCD